MTRRKTFIAIGIALSSLIAEGSTALDLGPSTSLTARTDGFLTRSDVRQRLPAGQQTEALRQACSSKTRAGIRCPPTPQAGPATAVDDFTANLPHLRLNIIWRQMRNVVVSGDGVGSLGAFQESWATFKIESANADVSIPALAADPYALPVPLPGQTWMSGPYANGLFQGIIHNGCLGPATFDLTLDSSVFRVSTGATFGDVHLIDAVDSPGYYNFSYTIRATDEAGNVSDFIFSGDADAFCTSESALSSQSGAGAKMTSSTAAIQQLPSTLKRSDFFTQEDIDRSPRGYPLFVPDVGTVYVKEVRSAYPGKSCTVHKDSVIRALAADPPVPAKPTWLQVTIYDCPWGGLCCFGPLGGGCYIMVSRG